MCITEQDSFDVYDSEISERFPEIKESLNKLDIILFLPISKKNSIEYTEENPEFRRAADKWFKKIYRDDIFDIFPRYGHPKIIEIAGDRKSRMKMFESYLI